MIVIPVVLSGGTGARLWPASRENHPKPFLKMADDESLLSKTYRRAFELLEELGSETHSLVTVTNNNYYFASKDELLRVNPTALSSCTFLLEPERRNTAPAIGLAAHFIAENYGLDAIIVAMPADHLIDSQSQFNETVKSALRLASNNYLVTFGIKPTSPETGYGYIETGESLENGLKVVRFVEKPTSDLAIQYVSNNKFFWNSGIFCFKANVLLKELTKHNPKLSQNISECWHSVKYPAEGNQVIHLPPNQFSKLQDISIDYAVLEKSQHVSMIPSSFVWDDIGTWRALARLTNADSNSNRSIGENIFVDSNNIFAKSEDRLIATIGVNDLVIIDTHDALLVAHTSKTQDVRKVVDQLKKQGHSTYKAHQTVSRPWGTYTVLEHGPRYKIKRIEVQPSASLSLQMHHHRSEHWVVVSGTAKVINGEHEMLVHTNESTYIPAGHKHRLENPGLVPLIMIEVQSGEYLGEDDIVRYDDQYGRTNPS